MKKEQQIQLTETIFKNLEKQKNKRDADGITHEIDAERYTSSDRLEKEKQHLFKNLPVVVGAAHQLENSGDYFLHDQVGVPIMVVRGKDGVLRAFLNMCRHRGVRLLEKEEGNIKRNIVCPYHAWTYDTEGCLKGVFHGQGFSNVDAGSHSLIELDCFVRLGMVFVVPNPEIQGEIKIDDWLEEVYSLTEGFDFGAFQPFHFTQGNLACNWKLIVDGALEGYHFKIAHAKTIGPYFLDNLSVNWENILHSSIIFPKKVMLELKNLSADEWNFRKAANILINIFPNTIILIEPDHIMVVCLYPVDEKTTTYKSFMLLPSKPANQKEEEYWKLNANIFWTAIQEDNEMAEMQQKSFDKYNDTSMTVGSYEKLLVQFESLVDDMLKADVIVS